MDKRFFFRLYSNSELLDAVMFENLWILFSDPLLKATRWGPYERTTEPFTLDHERPHRVLRTTRSVFVSGAAHGLLVQVERIGPRLYVLRIWLDAAALNRDRTRSPWLAWVYRLIESVRCLYGFGTARDDYDAKHVEENEDHRQAFGVSLRELSEFLPGIYWMTVFGEALTKALCVAKLEGTPGLVIKPLLPHQTVMLLDEPATPRDLEQRLERERDIAKRLGDDHFFDRARPKRKLRAVSAFRSALEAAESGDW
jgi:hypothetical protein